MRNLQISLPKVGTFSSRLLRQHRSQFASEYLISQPSNHPTTFPPAPCVDRLSTTRVVEAQNSQLGFVQGKSQHLSRGTKYLKVHHVDPSSISTKFNLPFFKLDIQMDVTIGYGDIPHLHLWVEPTKKKRIRRQTSLPSGLVLHAVQQKGLLFGLEQLISSTIEANKQKWPCKNTIIQTRKSKHSICWNQYDTKPTCCFSFNSHCCVPQLIYNK